MGTSYIDIILVTVNELCPSSIISSAVDSER